MWTEADNKNPHASAFYFFLLIFSSFFFFFFSPSLQWPFCSQTLFGKFCIPPIIVPNPPAVTTASVTSAITSRASPICLRLHHPFSRQGTPPPFPVKIRPNPPLHHSSSPLRQPCQESPPPYPPYPKHTPPADRPVRSGPVQSHHPPEPSVVEICLLFPVGQRSARAQPHQLPAKLLLRNRPTFPSLHSFSASITTFSLVSPFTSTGRS